MIQEASEKQPERRGPNLNRSVLSPEAALLVLIAACNLFLVHAALVFLLVAPPYSATEVLLLWGSGFVGLGLLVYGSTVAWSTLGRLRATEDRLTELGGRLDAIVDGSPLAITAADPDGRLVLWNPAAERLFGWRSDEVLGRHAPNVPESERPAWERLQEEALQGRTVGEMETARTTRDDRLVEVSVSGAPVRMRDGRIGGTMSVIADLSQRRQVEAERQRLQEQLLQAQKMEAVGRLAGGVAHDFNNILTAIRGNAELLLAGDVDPVEAREDLEEIRAATDRAAALTRQLLAFGRQGIARPRPLDMNRLVMDMERLLRRVIGKDIELDTELASDLGTVNADPGQLEQVLMNLAVNARDAMPGGGRIVIRTANALVKSGTTRHASASSRPYRVRPDDYVVVSVTDNGTGIEPETAGRIFEPFFTTKPIGVGTGLGLSTAYGIVKQARGYIHVDSDPGMGSTFNVYLPRVEALPETETDRQPTTAEVPGGTETILVVEDEEAVLTLATKVLTRSGYRVLAADRGARAVRIAQEFPGEIHLLFCDAVMPDTSGSDVARRVRALRPDIRVLMTSGYAEALMARQGVMDSGVDFLAKPYTTADLMQRTRAALGTAGGIR